MRLACSLLRFAYVGFVDGNKQLTSAPDRNARHMSDTADPSEGGKSDSVPSGECTCIYHNNSGRCSTDVNPVDENLTEAVNSIYAVSCRHVNEF